MIFSSPKKRCIETLEILYPDREPIVVEDLAECNFGDYEGKRFSELKDDADYQKWVSGALDCPPNGESSKEFQLRTCKAFEMIVDKLLRSGNKSAVIMAHGGSIMAILGTYGFPRRPMYEWMTKSGMGYELLITPQLWMTGKAVEIAGSLPLEPGESENTDSDEFNYFNAEIEDGDTNNETDETEDDSSN
jgi:alpha-ribazole phosphatase